MEYVFFAFIILTGYHYYIENVIVPAREAKLQGKLYLLYKRTSDIITNDQQVNEITEELRLMMLITARDIKYHNYLEFKFYELKNAHRHKEQEKSTWARYDVAFKKYPELQNIFNEYGKLSRKAFEISTTGWFIYLFPFILLYKGIKLIRNSSNRYRPKGQIVYKASSFENYKAFGRRIMHS